MHDSYAENQVNPSNNKKRLTPAYMAIFADLMTLLLCFFVLLLSMAEIDVVRFKRVADTMSNAFGLNSPDDPDPIPMAISVIQHTFSPNPTQKAIQLDPRQQADSTSEILANPDSEKFYRAFHLEKADLIAQQLRSALQQAELQIETRLDRAVIILDNKAAFSSGQAKLEPTILPVLQEIAAVLATMTKPIVVAGHTDNQPQLSSFYRSNWELSASRATSVVQQLLEYPALKASRLRIEGHADTRPLADNSSENGRARNRRVEIAVLTE